MTRQGGISLVLMNGEVRPIRAILSMTVWCIENHMANVDGSFSGSVNLMSHTCIKLFTQSRLGCSWVNSNAKRTLVSSSPFNCNVSEKSVERSFRCPVTLTTLRVHFHRYSRPAPKVRRRQSPQLRDYSGLLSQGRELKWRLCGNTPEVYLR